MSIPYIISKRLDPIFALSVGIAAAAVRINREEKEKGNTTQESVRSLRRRWDLLFEREEVGVGAGAGGKMDGKRAG
ncbi:hypothetical protein BDY17DRAFT_328163 [Neohortaea acidophila]|uniref:Non-classical export protein 1 n=1 Tax=Neohortaea acidophila TaxID=245834 RepID=A0A6A6PFA1_9PEZI|nr:uncharacterized protein BDY17DRAFT_328163 [Neohortaea acidophila]KAF2478632.1 hypothetical protein BDY17DRAFT_328163 [Neohortaea acidophila]